MKISTRLRLVGLSSIVAVIGIVAVLAHANSRIERELAGDALAAEVVAAATSLRYLSLEYLLRNEERTRAQWEARYASFSLLLAANIARGNLDEQERFERLRQLNKRLGSVFRDVIANRRSADVRNATRAELDTVLAGQTVSQTTEMIAVAQRMAHEYRLRLAAAQRRASFAIAAFGGALAIIVLGMLYLVIKSITTPLNKLREGTVIVGAGDLDFRLNNTSPDEIGDVARAFDRMTENTAHAIAARASTEQHLAEHVEALARSNTELEQFAYVASHDLQEPLRMVASYTQLLKRRYQGKLGADADEFIYFAVDGATRMQKLIQDLLAYSRLSTREGVYSHIDCNVAVDHALANLGAAIAEHHVEVTRGPLPWVNAEVTQLTQLFQNLIGNAIKFHSERPPTIDISATHRDREWLFCIRDNGIGIDAQYKDRIFIIFQRLHTRERYAGTGIGLAICKKIVERHGGRIGFDSELGQGTTFWFTLPDSSTEAKTHPS